MHLPHRFSAFMFLALLVLGCGKKSGSDTKPTPEPTSAGQPTAGPPGIEGTYLVIGAELWGDKVPDEEVAKDAELERTVKISKDRIQLKMFKDREIVRYKLDPSRSPAEIDILLDTSGKGEMWSNGIYKVEGTTLTLFVWGAKEPQYRPREFKTLALPKDGKPNKDADKQVGGMMLLVLKKVSDDTTFISEPPPKPKPPAVDEDGPVVAELTKKGFIAEKMPYGKFPGINVTVPSTMPIEAIKELNGHARIRSLTFKPTGGFEDRSHPVTDEVIQALNGLDGLFSVEFSSCPKITGAAFRGIGRFPLLTGIFISDSPVDDAATEEFAKLKALENVKFGGKTKITDKSLANLAKIKTLKSIWLSEADVTASGIKQFNALPDLEALFLQNMPVADAALGELSLPKLTTLNLARSNITDEGLAKLPVLPALRDLLLSGAKVTDVGSKHLLKQPKLESVWFDDTKVTKAGVEELKKLKPKLIITGVN